MNVDSAKEKFDGFQRYFNHLKTNGDCNSDSHFIREMYFLYYKPSDGVISQRQLQKLGEEKRKALAETFDLCKKYRDNSRLLFEEMCDQLFIDDYTEVQNIVPFRKEDLQTFVANFRFDRDPYLPKEENIFVGRNILLKQISLLIVFDIYDNQDTADAELLNKWLITAEEAIRRNKHFKNVPSSINRIKQLVYMWCSRLNIKAVIPIKTYRKNGDFLITWDFIEFLDGKINVYHPLKYPYSPLVVENKKSRKAMNGIKGYLSERSPYVAVHATNGFIDDVYKNDLLESVEILCQRLHSVTAMKAERQSGHFNKSMSQSEIRHKIQELKSVYLDFLCKQQLSQHTIIYCPENRISSDGTQTDEDAFIFTISETSDKTKLIFENTLDKRVSIMLVCDNSQYDNVVRTVSHYFASEIINKRDNIYLLVEMLKPYNVLFRKIIHIDYYTWKGSILRSIIQ